MPLVKISKIYNVDARIWYLVIFAAHGLIGALMVTSLLSSSWIEVGPDSLLKGSLFQVKEFGGESESKNWNSYYNDHCDSSSLRKLGICKLFENLYWGSIIFGAGEAIAILCMLSSAINFLQWIFGSRSNFLCSHRPYAEAALMTGFHYAASILWIVWAGAKYSGSCDYEGDLNSTPSTCTRDGANMALALMIIMPILVGLYIFIFQKAYKELKEARFKEIRAPLANNANANVLGFIPQNPYGPNAQVLYV